MVRGGLSGTFLSERWLMLALFTDIPTVRNYFGDVLAHEILMKIGIITYLLLISVPYTMLFIFEVLYTDVVYLVTSLIEVTFFTITFSMFMLVVEEV